MGVGRAGGDAGGATSGAECPTRGGMDTWRDGHVSHVAVTPSRDSQGVRSLLCNGDCTPRACSATEGQSRWVPRPCPEALTAPPHLLPAPRRVLRGQAPAHGLELLPLPLPGPGPQLHRDPPGGLPQPRWVPGPRGGGAPRSPREPLCPGSSRCTLGSPGKLPHYLSPSPGLQPGNRTWTVHYIPEVSPGAQEDPRAAPSPPAGGGSRGALGGRRAQLQAGGQWVMARGEPCCCQCSECGQKMRAHRPGWQLVTAARPSGPQGLRVWPRLRSSGEAVAVGELGARRGPRSLLPGSRARACVGEGPGGAACSSRSLAPDADGHGLLPPQPGPPLWGCSTTRCTAT